MQLRDLSFGLKLKLLVLLAAAGPLLLAVWALLQYERRFLIDAQVAEVGSAARVVAGNTTAALAFGDAEAARENLASLAAMPELAAAAVYDARGRLFAAYAARPGAEQGLPATAPPLGSRVEAGDILLSQPLLLKGERVGTVVLRSGTGGVAARLRQHATTIVLVLMGSGAIVLLLATRVQHALIAPLRRLGAAARCVSEGGDYGVRVPVTAGDEVGDLTDAFNHMLAQIQERDSALTAARDELEQRVRERVAQLEREVNERLQVESALHDSQGKLRDILEHSSNLFYSHGPDHVLNFVSPQARAFLDCTPEEALIKWTEFVPDTEVNARAFESTARALATGQRQPPYELELVTAAGRKVWVEVNEAPVVREGAVVAIVGALTDITDRKHAELEHTLLEDQFRQAQKMEAIGRLAGGVAHDFNNLLGVILGYSELLRRDLHPGGREEQRLREIVKAANRAAGLTRQLLAFSRKQVLDARVLDLGTVVGDMEGMLSRLIREDIRLQVRCDPAPWTVKADRGQIEQVLMNLAVNSRDAMPHGGSLSIEVANVDTGRACAAAGLAPGRYVRLSVADTGCGMDPATLSHVFEPFFTTKPTGEGTGLGLATVYGIVKQSGGAVTVDSAPGRGSTFAVYLPAVEEAHAAPAGAAEAPRRGSGTLLIVEDEDALRRLTRELLEAHGYT
ncbi:MAG TPA: ATP-binding protein, partial [Vicinamibacteria bacterium]|nr:ATP-binding protein [Vicinamibacteria bacterium]